MRPIAQRIELMGTIVEGDTLYVAAPLDSRIVATHVLMGQHVEQGQPLLTIDIADAAQKARMARLELAKATHRFRQLENWEDGTEVVRARRLAGEAEQTLAESRQRLNELDILLAKGIIPRLEHDAAQRQVKQAETQYLLLREELEQVQSKGTGAELEIARMDMQVAAQRASELDQLAASGLLKAGRSGIILEPAKATRSDEATARLSPGSPISKGKPLYRIVDGGSVKVVFRLSEVDVNRVQVGQAVELRGDGFSGQLNGRICDIAAVGDTAAGPGANMAMFEVHALVPKLDDTQRKQVRLGMSASVSIIGPSRTALVLPLRAIGEREGKPVVVVADAATGRHVERVIATGSLAGDDMEIVSGLDAGETVLLPQHSDAARVP